MKVEEIDGESLDQLLAARDILIKKHPKNEYEIIPGEAEASRMFLLENNLGGGVIIDGSCRRKLPDHVYKKLSAWLPNEKMNMRQINGWVLVDFQSGADDVLAIALDGGPLFY